MHDDAVEHIAKHRSLESMKKEKNETLAVMIFAKRIINQIAYLNRNRSLYGFVYIKFLSKFTIILA